MLYPVLILTIGDKQSNRDVLLVLIVDIMERRSESNNTLNYL